MGEIQTCSSHLIILMTRPACLGITLIGRFGWFREFDFPVHRWRQVGQVFCSWKRKKTERTFSRSFEAQLLVEEYFVERLWPTKTEPILWSFHRSGQSAISWSESGGLVSWFRIGLVLRADLQLKSFSANSFNKKLSPSYSKYPTKFLRAVDVEIFLSVWRRYWLVIQEPSPVSLQDCTPVQSFILFLSLYLPLFVCNSASNTLSSNLTVVQKCISN